MINMNILIITPYFPPRKGGVEHYTYHISRKLSESGHEVTVLTVGQSREERFDDLRIIRKKNRFWVSNTPIDFLLPVKLSKVLQNGNFDLVNAHLGQFYADVATITTKINKVPLVLTYHNDIVKNDSLKIFSSVYNKTILPATLRLADKIITSSPYVYNESAIMQKFIDKMTLVPPGVDLNYYNVGKSFAKEKYGLPDCSKIILFVGSMNRGHTHKGVGLLLEAFSKIASDETYLILVGGGDMVSSYKKLAKSLGIYNKVIFTGFIDEESLIDLYRGSYMLILPTLTVAEGFGMVLIEANACGTPVIGSAVGGIKYVIRDGETGLLVPPGDSDALAGAMKKLLDNKDLAEKMGANGRKMVLDNYTWERSVRMTERVFEDTLKQFQ